MGPKISGKSEIPELHPNQAPRPLLSSPDVSSWILEALNRDNVPCSGSMPTQPSSGLAGALGPEIYAAPVYVEVYVAPVSGVSWAGKW